MSNQNFDVCIIGGGPGGYVAAIRCAQLGLRVALAEKEHLGGICLNWGCIPTKALLSSAEVMQACKHAEKYGVTLPSGGPKANLAAITARSRAVSQRLANGVKGLMKKNKIEVIEGVAVMQSKNLVRVATPNGTVEVSAKYIIIASGARARQLTGFEADNQMVWDYKGAMSQEKLPPSLIVVGSGAIGMEFASFYNAIGVDVTVLEAAPNICPTEDEEISSYAMKVFAKEGIKFETSIQLKELSKQKSFIEITYQTQGSEKKAKADRLLMAVGTVPNTENIGIANVNVNLDKGRVKVDEKCKTNVSSIYAIGDVNSKGPFLAHKASHEGICVAEEIASIEGKISPSKAHLMEYNAIPGCIYTTPQIASVGLTEKQALSAGMKIKVGKFSAVANGKAIAIGEEEGMVKVIFDERTGELLGAHMFGASVTEIIQGFCIAKTGELTENELISAIFPHPTISEMMHEAVLSAFGRVIHS